MILLVLIVAALSYPYSSNCAPKFDAAQMQMVTSVLQDGRPSSVYLAAKCDLTKP